MGKSTAAATAQVARHLLAVAGGEQIPTTAQLAHELGVGYGTVHAALKTLQDTGAVTLSTHGHQGTRMVSRDMVTLWRASDRDSLIGLLPLPQSTEFAALATATMSVADKAGFPLQLIFRQAAAERFTLLREERVDWILTSGFAAAREATWCDAVLLPEHTYYSRDSVVVITAGRAPVADGQVAIDRRSYDHTMLTLAEFPDADYIDTAYWWIPDMVASGKVDAAIWHRTSSSSLVTATSLSIHPLRTPHSARPAELTRAALVHRRQDVPTREALATLIEPRELADLQHQVMTRRIPPAF